MLWSQTLTPTSTVLTNPNMNLARRTLRTTKKSGLRSRSEYNQKDSKANLGLFLKCIATKRVRIWPFRNRKIDCTRIDSNPNYFIFVEGYSEEGDVGQGTSVTLWLGKRVGNILVFKYPTHKSFIYDNSAGKKLLLDDYDGIHYCSEGPLDYRFCDFLYGYVMFQFNEFTDEMLEVLFEHSIQINSDAVLYLTMDLLQ